jgi:hypothetical protein
MCNKGLNMERSRKTIVRAGIVAGLASLAFGFFTPLFAASDNAASKWKVWTYNPSNRAFKGSVPATSSGNVLATFPLPATPDVALLVTDHGAYKDILLGDLTGKTLSATVSDSGGPFTYYGANTPSNPCPGTATVRFYFQTKSPASFAETDYWWSNPVSLPLNGLNAPTPMSAPLTPTNWSDYNGHLASDPAYTAAFQAAVKNVTSIGLSFGGGCFFENGVGAPNGGTFTLKSFSASP